MLFTDSVRFSLAHFYKSAFPNLLSYPRFVEVMPTALVPLFSYFASLKSEPTGSEFFDSTSIKVCHNLRIKRHKTLSGMACMGSKFTGYELQRFLKEHNLKDSMSRRRNCHYNACAESFFQWLNRERVKRKVYASR